MDQGDGKTAVKVRGGFNLRDWSLLNGLEEEEPVERQVKTPPRVTDAGKVEGERKLRFGLEEG